MGGINGNASVYIRADPNVVLDFNTCKVPSYRTNDWNDGFGIDGNTGDHKKTTNGGLLSGSYHSNLRRAGCDGALVGLPNYAPFGSAKQISFIEFNGNSHYENDYACCQKCQNTVDCDAWETSKGYKDNGRKCRLHTFWKPDVTNHGNWKGENVSRGNNWGLGATHSVINVAGDTQEERDAHCADLCVSDEKCDLWVQKTTSRTCKLQGALRNSGWLGVGRFVVNWIVDRMVHKLLDKLMSKVCNLGGVKMIMKILEAAEHWTMTGNGYVSIDVPADFWDTPASDFWSSPSSYNNVTFGSHTVGLDSIQADRQIVTQVVQEIVGGIADDFSAGKVAEELGTPVAFFIGSLIKECADNKCNGDSASVVV